MNLPVIDLPIPPLPVDIPVLMHPPLVHFAIVLPIFILLLEIINVIMKRKALTVTTFLFFTLLIVVFAGAYLTGKTDGKEAWDMLSAAGQADLKEHKLIGTYLLLGSVVLVFLKLFDIAIRRWWMKLLYLLVLIGFVAAVLYQGKEGGELVFEHGANVEKVKTLDDQVFDLKEEISDMGDDDESGVTEPEKAQEPAVEEKVEEKPAAKSDESKNKEAPAAEDIQKSAEKPAAESNESKTQEAPATEAIQKGTEKAVEATKETASDTVKNVKEAATKAADTVTEKTKNAVESVKEAAKPVTDMIKSIKDDQ